MRDGPLDVVGIGNAIVDVLVRVDDRWLVEHGLKKGTMTLIDDDRAEKLAVSIGKGVECSGGSAANTMAGLASFGGRGAYMGKVRRDRLGAVFASDIRSVGVEYATPAAASGPATGRCLVLVTPDAQRTMQTYLGASGTFGPADLDPDVIHRARITYLEGYLWDPPEAKRAFLRACRIAHEAGRRVALTLSDPFCVDRHRDDLLALIREHVDIVFANRDELLALFETAAFDEAFSSLRAVCPTAVVTCGAEGSIAADARGVSTIAAVTLSGVVDTTGAGDLYAAGFLFGLARELPLARCGELGSLAAAEIIGHLGARPEVRLAELAASRGLARGG
ncbi:MAG TPA: adenosine kinase [Candidatus Polarisedimenticolaceae bacterium]|nr:adenosine kinase [Candidatus Polarisedimenticolaceae bacterium]